MLTGCLTDGTLTVFPRGMLALSILHIHMIPAAVDHISQAQEAAVLNSHCGIAARGCNLLVAVVGIQVQCTGGSVDDNLGSTIGHSDLHHLGSIVHLVALYGLAQIGHFQSLLTNAQNEGQGLLLAAFFTQIVAVIGRMGAGGCTSGTYALVVPVVAQRLAALLDCIAVIQRTLRAGFTGGIAKDVLGMGIGGINVNDQVIHAITVPVHLVGGGFAVFLGQVTLAETVGTVFVGFQTIGIQSLDATPGSGELGIGSIYTLGNVQIELDGIVGSITGVSQRDGATVNFLDYLGLVRQSHNRESMHSVHHRSFCDGDGDGVGDIVVDVIHIGSIIGDAFGSQDEGQFIVHSQSLIGLEGDGTQHALVEGDRTGFGIGVTVHAQKLEIALCSHIPHGQIVTGSTSFVAYIGYFFGIIFHHELETGNIVHGLIGGYRQGKGFTRTDFVLVCCQRDRQVFCCRCGYCKAEEHCNNQHKRKNSFHKILHLLSHPIGMRNLSDLSFRERAQALTWESPAL